MSMSLLKTKVVEIPKSPEGDRENRDGGKSFLVTEMPALQAERWGRHAVAAMNRNDLDVRAELGQLGMLGFYLIGLQALAGGDIAAVDVLMDQMLPQFKIIESPTLSRVMNPDGSDISEVTTIFLLRKELIELTMGFTFAEIASILAAKVSAMNQEQSTTQT